MNDQTVAEYLSGCSMALLSELAADGSDYWSTVEEFIGEHEDRILASLTPKQRVWLIKIKEDLLDEAGK